MNITILMKPLLIASIISFTLVGCGSGDSAGDTDPTPPAPTEPAPTEPAPTEPAPTEPAPTEPAPTEPAPTEPTPTEPAPTEPAPTEPAPTEPAPTEPAPTEPVALTHPGMLSDLTQLNILKDRYQSGHVTTTKLVQEMITEVNKSGVRIRNPGTENSETGGKELIYCGSYNKGRDGTTTVAACNWPAENGVTAYTNALLGYIVNDSAYSDVAIAYLESWSNVENFAGFDIEGSNAALQHGWIIPWYANTAEILRYTYSGWTEDLTAKMDGFINRLLPLTIDDMEGAPNNWLHSRIEAHISAAIWFDDKAMLTTAINRWKEHTRAYIYIDADNGTPVMPTSSKSASKGKRDWDTPKFVEGLTLETCRDINHQSLGMRSIFNSLAMTKSQNIDILAGNDNGARLYAFFEVMPKWIRSLTDNPDGICNKPVIYQGSDATGAKLSSEVRLYSYPLGYSLLKTTEKPLTLAKQDIDESDSVTASKWVKKWESLIASTYNP